MAQRHGNPSCPARHPRDPPGGPLRCSNGAYGTNVVTVKYPASFCATTAAAGPTGPPVLGVSVDEGIASLRKGNRKQLGHRRWSAHAGLTGVDDVRDDLDRTGTQPDADLTFCRDCRPAAGERPASFTVFLPTAPTFRS